jgi:hypothetical protein
MLGHAEPARALAKKWSVSRQENVEASLDTPHLYRSLHYTWLLARNNDCIYATEHISRKSQEFSPRLTWRAQAAAAGSRHMVLRHPISTSLRASLDEIWDRKSESRLVIRVASRQMPYTLPIPLEKPLSNGHRHQITFTSSPISRFYSPVVSS